MKNSQKLGRWLGRQWDKVPFAVQAGVYATAGLIVIVFVLVKVL